MRLLDLFVFKYNRTDFHELNLDWIISDMRTLAETLENFVSLNTIKYADPIQWNITKQYGTNTVVIDANDGTAYLSVQPVPTGVAITNTDYWTPIFTLNLLSANQNITLRDDGSNVLATFASNADDWLIWNATLYKVLQPIAVNEAYVVGYNLDRYSVELFIKDYIDALKNEIGALSDLTTTDKSSIVNAINEVKDNTDTIATNVGTLSDLETTDQSSIVNAINEVNDKIINFKSYYNNVADMIADDTLSSGDVVICLGYYAASDLGSGKWLVSDTATNYFHLANADNTLFFYPICENGRNVHQYGAYGDNTHDDSAAINAAIYDSELQALTLEPSLPIIFNGLAYRVENTIVIGCYSIKLIGNGCTIVGALNAPILETSNRSSNFLHSILLDNLVLQFHADYKHNYACFQTTWPIYLSRITSLKLYGGRIGWDARKAAGVDTDWGLTIGTINVGDFTVNGLYMAETTAGSPNWDIQSIYVQCGSMVASGNALHFYNMHSMHIGVIEFNQNNNGGTLIRAEYVFNAIIDTIRVEGCLASVYRYIVVNASQITFNSIFFNPFTFDTATSVALILGTNAAQILVNKVRCNDSNSSLTKYIFRLEDTSWAALYDGHNITNLTLSQLGTPSVVIS